MDVKILQEQYRSKQLQQKRKIRLLQLLVLIGLFLFWELATRYRLLDPLIFSSPTGVTKLFLTKLFDGTLLPHVVVTLLETVAGFLLGTLFGTVLAIILWSSSTVAKVLDPY